MLSGPGLAFASRIAWRSEPESEGAVFVTVNVAAGSRKRQETEAR